MLDGRAGKDVIEIRRTADLESPAEDSLVETPCPLYVTGKNLEVRAVICHTRF